MQKMISSYGNTLRSRFAEIVLWTEKKTGEHFGVFASAILITGVILYVAFALGSWVNGQLIPYGEHAAPEWVYTIFFAFFSFYVIGIVFPFLLFLGWRLGHSHHQANVYRTPMVSVIIPAYNEQGAVTRSIQGALDQDYPNLEVILVDDGSKDFTPYLIEDHRITFVRLKRNRGKAAALNAGIDRAKGEIIVFSDADSFLDREAVRHLVKHFNDPCIGAVAGRVDVPHSSSLLIDWQILEYVLGQEVVKKAQLGSGTSVAICPGPLSAFRRTVLLELGGLKDRTLAEDFDVTLETINQDYRVGYEPRAIAWTQTPNTWAALRRQRIRWYRGSLQVFTIHRHLFLNARAGLFGLFWLPYSLLVGFGGVLIETCLLASFPILLWITGAPLSSLYQGLIFMLLIELLGAGQYLIALRLAGRWHTSLALSAFVVKPYHVFLAWARLISIGREIKQRESTWSD